jgi:hypothetical protein
MLALAGLAFGVVLATVHREPGLAESPPPSALIVITGAGAAGPEASGVALDTITSQVSGDRDVLAVSRRPATEPNVTELELQLVPLDSGERRAALDRIEASIDPGPLSVALGGADGTLRTGADDGSREARRLAPIGLALAALMILALIGSSTLVGTILAGAFATLGTLAFARLGEGPLDLHLIGIVSAAALAAALACELTLRVSGEGEAAANDAAIGALIAALASGSLALIPLGYMRTAALCGAIASLLAGLAAIAAGAAARGIHADEHPRRLASVWRATARLVAWRRLGAALIGLSAAGALAGLAGPLLGAKVVALAPGVDLVGRFTDAVPAALIAATVACGLIAGVASRSGALGLLAPLALLPALAAAGVAVLTFGDANLTGALDYTPSGGIHLAPVAVGASCVGTLSLARWGLAAAATDPVDRNPERRAGDAMALGAAPVLFSGLLLIGGGVALLFSDFSYVKELGLVIAVGELLDLFVAQALIAPAAIGLGR